MGTEHRPRGTNVRVIGSNPRKWRKWMTESERIIEKKDWSLQVEKVH